MIHIVFDSNAFVSELNPFLSLLIRLSPVGLINHQPLRHALLGKARRHFSDLSSVLADISS